MGTKKIYVYEHWSTEKPIFLGTLYINVIKGKEVYSFEYDDAWLIKEKTNMMLDPDLEYYHGRQYVPLDKRFFGLFSDSSPDRWGRQLIMRREAICARKENRKPRALFESDYLLGVYDKSRMGALRFSIEVGNKFVSDDECLATPPWTTLRELEYASMAYETNDNPVNDRWINILMAPGSSLGGARPKASVLAPDDSLWIAKFPSKNDEWDSGAWEMVVHDLAELCDLNVPEAKLEKFSQYGSTFLVKRFDRDGERRLHFASAMTLLGRVDGASGEDAASYLDMAEFIKAYGANPKNDLKELWRRVIFSIFVSNTDDHLRNHGFILQKNGWRLSPVFDVNPSIYGHHLSLNISQYDSTLDIQLAIDTANFYGIENTDAVQMIHEISETIANNWKKIALKHGLTRQSIEYMKPAFQLTENA